MSKRNYILATVCLIVLLTFAAIYLVDATVQIDDDYGILCLFILLIDSMMGAIAYLGFKKMYA